MEHHAQVLWFGSGSDGSGMITTQSDLIHQGQYSFSSRFENDKGTNPEELLAAAHASCYTMNLSCVLGMAGFIPDRLQTTSFIVSQKNEIVESHLEIIADVPNLDQQGFDRLVQRALQTCPITNLMKVKITTKHSLVS
jgi:lipoyl-dependent peroxiredoxin